MLQVEAEEGHMLMAHIPVLVLAHRQLLILLVLQVVALPTLLQVVVVL